MVGRDADKTEEELFGRLLDRSFLSDDGGHSDLSNRTSNNISGSNRIRRYLETLAPDDALDLARECLQARMTASFQQQQQQQQPSSTMAAAAAGALAAEGAEKVYWQAIIMDYSGSQSASSSWRGGGPSAGTPRRIFRRGAFVLPRKGT